MDLEIRSPGNLDGDFAPHTLEDLLFHFRFMAYYFRRRSFPLVSAKHKSHEGEGILRRGPHKKREKE